MNQISTQCKYERFLLRQRLNAVPWKAVTKHFSSTTIPLDKGSQNHCGRHRLAPGKNHLSGIHW